MERRGREQKSQGENKKEPVTGIQVRQEIVAWSSDRKEAERYTGWSYILEFKEKTHVSLERSGNGL